MSASMKTAVDTCARCGVVPSDIGGLCLWCDGDDHGDLASVITASGPDPRGGPFAQIARACAIGAFGAAECNAKGRDVAAAIRAEGQRSRADAHGPTYPLRGKPGRPPKDLGHADPVTRSDPSDGEEETPTISDESEADHGS